MARKIAKFLIRFITRLPLLGLYAAGDEPWLGILIFLSPLIALVLALLWAGSKPAGANRNLAYFVVAAGALGIVFLLIGLNMWARTDSDDEETKFK